MAPKKDKQDDLERLDMLQLKRTKVVDNILRIKKSVMEKTISLNHVELECRLEILNSYISQAMSIQDELEMLDPSINSRSELENICVSTKALLKTPLVKFKRTISDDTSVLGTGTHSHQSRLPKMRLPKFSGKYSEFKNFYSLFENLVNNDTSLSDIEKFNHLISCLSGDALGTIKAFQVTEQNYKKALESLKKVYDNKCLIFFDTISQLFQLPIINKPSASGLRSIIDTVSAIYDSLLSVGDDKSISNAFLIHIVMSKIDSDSRVKYEEQLDYNQLPMWSDCEKVLNKRYQQISAEEASKHKKNEPNFSKFERVQRNKSKSSHFASKQDALSGSCVNCQGSGHHLSACPSFTTLAVRDRLDFVKKNQLCINCLRKGHTVSKCKSTNCRVCNKPHNTMLHIYQTSSSNITTILTSEDNLPPLHERLDLNTANVNIALSQEDKVILATAVIKIKDYSGQFHCVRAMLDSGSQINFISEELVQKLRLKKQNSLLTITTVNSATSTSKHLVHAFCQSRINEHKFDSDFYVLRRISSIHPEVKLPYDKWNIPSNIALADPLFHKPQKVDMLIGAELFFDLLCVGQIKLSPSIPILQKTLLGWIVSGKYSQSATCLLSSIEPDVIANPITVDELVRKFWTLEEVHSSIKPNFSEEQQECESHFLQTVKMLDIGRLKVKLPFKGDVQDLGSSYESAQRRFLALERKLKRDNELKGMYNAFMQEYWDLGHMSLAPSNVTSGTHYFIPHQCVLRPESTTTKLRVVFDASAKTSTGVSLNDILMVGSFIQDDLFSILLRFRLNQYALTADITKMYRQVLVDEADRKYQLILWRPKESDPIQTFQLNTVTYGTASAPFLATRSLLYLSEIFEGSYTTGAKVLKEEFYVDDMLTGAQTLEDLNVIRSQVSEILSRGGFQLAKWFSNHPNYFSTDTEEISLTVNETDSTKALGLRWFPKNDHFTFRLDPSFASLRATKRNILSVSSRLFDPLGLLCPLITKAKIMLQELWLKKLDWDEAIPQYLTNDWENFKLNLSQLPSLTIPRFVDTVPEAIISVHGFADASVRAYGCCIYIRSQSPTGIVVKLLTAKSKVAPLKTKTLPRLELCAAHLLTKLWCKVKPLLLKSLQIANVTFWTDSEIVLYWIKNHSSTLSVFVANRVAEIQENSTDAQWFHVPSKQNPADIVSRGCDVNYLKHSMWFSGPQFLLRDPETWPKNHHFDLTEEQKLLEVKKSSISLLVTNESNHLIELILRHSSFPKIIGIFCHAYRIKIFAPPTETRENVGYSAHEKSLAFLKIIEILQRDAFPNEIAKLQSSQLLKPQLQKLNPFIQTLTINKRSFSLLRVGGRLRNAPQLSPDSKFPLLLPKNCHFVMVYLKHLHIKHCHAGAKILLGLLRQKVWLVNAREACSRIVRKCVHCFRYKPKLLQQIMGDLPADRLQEIRPFSVCGVDFFGPVYVSLRIRGRQPIKMYVAVFVCFASKAVHFELVDNLSTDCFLSVLSRFIGRRGIPRKIYCDNATNFVGTNNVMKELSTTFENQRQRLQYFASEKGIDFKFIPPRAPHFGGLWEAAVKQAKNHLLKNIGNANLTASEVTTMLVEVEAILNSRPIAPASSDPNDGRALTPGHLLIGEEIVSLPHASARDIPDSKLTYLKRYQVLSAIKQRFWRAWLKDYVLDLQARTKWSVEQPNLKIGALVVIHEDNLPPQRWLLGRVTAITPGADGKVRVAQIKTATGNLCRPIHKLAELPIS